MTNRALAATAATGAAAFAAARLAYRALTRFPPGGEKAWTRVNHRGEPVTLLEGPAAVAGAVAASLAVAAVSVPSRAERDRLALMTQPATLRVPAALPPRLAVAIAVAGGGAAAFGLLDDLKGSGKRRGLRGHLGALRHGEVTTGTVKLAGIGAAGAAGAVLLRGGLPPRTPPLNAVGVLLRGGLPRDHGATPVDCAINAGLIAGGANLLNLFDLRPGRAIKVAALTAGLISAVSAGSGSGGNGAAAVAVPLGAALAVLPEDLAEQAMLGDAGANSLGAMLGVAAAATLPRPARIGLLAGIIALTGLSEKVSFTKVIARTPALNWLDMLGRRAPHSPGTAPLSVPQDLPSTGLGRTLPSTPHNPPK